MKRETRRRATWIVHNALMTPFIPIRLVLWLLVRTGEIADRMLDVVPGWRRHNGWSGW